MKIKSSFIILKGVRLHGFIGVGEQEKVVGNDYLLDIRIEYPYQAAVNSDDLTHTLNYAAVYELVKRVLDEPCNLLEYAAGKIGKSLFQTFEEILSIDIKLLKLAPPMGADCYGAGVELHLTNEKNRL